MNVGFHLCNYIPHDYVEADHDKNVNLQPLLYGVTRDKVNMEYLRGVTCGNHLTHEKSEIIHWFNLPNLVLSQKRDFCN